MRPRVGRGLPWSLQPQQKGPGLSYPGCQPPRLVLMKETCPQGGLQMVLASIAFLIIGLARYPAGPNQMVTGSPYRKPWSM